MNLPIKKNNTKKDVNMSNKGAKLEQLVNESNEYYRYYDIAVIHKKPVPVQIVKVSYPSRNKAVITEAYYKIPSTTDYNGIYKGYYVDFDCKECNSLTSFPIKNVHDHQVKHLLSIKKHNGIAFLLINLIKFNEYYLLDIDDFKPYWQNAKDGLKKSIPITDIQKLGVKINLSYKPSIDYLKGVDVLIEKFNK